jgi:metal-dependent amidase/aminoacylase/carboxypeptidase family protein
VNDLDRLKTRVTDAVDRLAEDLWSLALQIHANPELAFKEEKAAAWLTALLERHGCRVERGVGGLATAFRAEVPGAGAGPTIAVMAEYDALPGRRWPSSRARSRRRACRTAAASSCWARPPRKAAPARSSSSRPARFATSTPR